MMTLFDAPNRESSCVRRSRSNTALQSLGLLNEVQRTETARALAGRLLKESADDTSRLDQLFKLLACRTPDETERSACINLLNTMRVRFSENKEAALQLLATGLSPRDESLDPSEHAAWSQVTSTVLASDITILLY